MTFRLNYRLCGLALKADLVGNPARVKEPIVGARSAAWYWSTHGLNYLADKADLKGMTRAINGGLTGLEERAKLYAHAREVLGV